MGPHTDITIEFRRQSKCILYIAVVVPQAQVGQASDEHQAVGQSCQLVVVEMEHTESREGGERLGQLPEIIVAQ